MVKFILLMISVCFLAACAQESKYKFWKLSKFNIQDSALKDEEKIKLLYTSQGPDDEGKQDYYIQVIVVSQITGDTVNILTTVNNGFSVDDSATVFNYFTPDHPGVNLIDMTEEEISKGKNISDSNVRQPEKFLKVARDPLHDDLADNLYPTVFGFIGKKPN